MSGIRRRELITLFGGAASWPFVARAEQSARPVIGLMHATIQANDEFVAAFKDSLSQTGYVDGRNVTIEFRSAETEKEIERAFDDFGQQRADALLILSDSFLNGHAPRIAELALAHGLPTCFAYREPAVSGGLMSYGASRTESSHQAGTYVGRILHGEKPADLPVQQPTKFEFVINMKTAKALGLVVPYSMQMLADEVIE